MIISKILIFKINSYMSIIKICAEMIIKNSKNYYLKKIYNMIYILLRIYTTKWKQLRKCNKKTKIEKMF